MVDVLETKSYEEQLRKLDIFVWRREGREVA